MQRAALDLNDFVPLWERKIEDNISETEFDRLLGSDVDLLEPALGQKRIGNACALAQDVFSALIIRQSSGQG